MSNHAPKPTRAFYVCGGALMCNEEIPGLTQDLSKGPGDVAGSIKFYGGQHFVCETIMVDAARRIAEALGGKFFEEEEDE